MKRTLLLAALLAALVAAPAFAQTPPATIGQPFIPAPWWMKDPVIASMGHVRTEVPANRARFAARFSVVEKTAAAATTAATAKAKELDAALAALGKDRVRLTTSLSTRPLYDQYRQKDGTLVENQRADMIESYEVTAVLSVEVRDADVLQPPGRTPSVFATLRPQLSQLILTHLYLGLAEGALASARAFQREQARPCFASGVQASGDDPYIQHRYGELALDIRAAQPVAGEAAQALDAAFRQGGDLQAAERGEVAIAVAQAKALAHRAAMRITGEFFELTGARSTSARLGLDRFWRNARVHTLHDPIDYKLRDLGRHYLTGRLPEPTPYS